MLFNRLDIIMQEYYCFRYTNRPTARATRDSQELHVMCQNPICRSTPTERYNNRMFLKFRFRVLPNND